MYKPTRGSFSFIRDALNSAFLSCFDEQADMQALSEVLTDALTELDKLHDWVAETFDEPEVIVADGYVNELDEDSWWNQAERVELDDDFEDYYDEE